MTITGWPQFSITANRSGRGTTDLLRGQDVRGPDAAITRRARCDLRFQTTWREPFLMVLLAATIVRLAWIVYVFATRSSAFSSFTLDWSNEIGQIATNIYGGRGFSSPFRLGAQPTAWECPVVPYLFAGFLRLAGGNTDNASRLIGLSQAWMGGFTAAVYWLIGRHASLRHPGLFPAWFSPALAVVVILWPESIYSVSNAWYCVWQEAALAVFVLLAMRWWDRASFGSSVSVGLAGGGAALINVSPLPIIAFVFLFPMLRRRGRGSILGPTMVAVASFALVVTPWLVRNGVVFRTFVPLRSNTGYEIFQGNNELECIRQPGHPRHPGTDKQEFERYLKLGEIRYCRECVERSAAYVRQHPWETVRRTGIRVYVCWLTDITDRWNPEPEHRWWSGSSLSIARYLATVLLTAVSVGIVLWALFGRRFRSLPYAPLLAAVILLLPIAHYFTLADAEYTVAFRMWVGVIAVELLGCISSRSRETDSGLRRTPAFSGRDQA